MHAALHWRHSELKPELNVATELEQGGPASLMALSDWVAVLTALLPWIVATLLVVLLIYGFHPLARWRFRFIPGPPPSWLLGNLPELVRKGQHVAYLDWERRYGPIYKIFLGGNMVVVVGDAVAARKVARSSAWRAGLRFLDVGEEQKFNEYGIIASRGDAWRATSNAWQPFFARGSLAKFMPLMVQSADRLAALLGECADSGQEVDIWRQFGNMAMDVVGSTAFGVDFRTLESDTTSSAAPSPAAAPTKTAPGTSALPPTLPSSDASNSPQLAPETPTHMKEGPVRAEGAGAGAAGATAADGEGASRHRVATPAGQLVQAVRDIFDGFDPKNPWFALHMLFPELDLLVRWAANIFPTAKFNKTKQGRRTLRSVARQLLADYKASTAGGAAAELAATGGKGVDPGSFFALQARAIDRTTGEHFPEDWVIQQAFIFIGGGYETTANALAACAYCLAAHPDKESKLLAEVDCFGREREPTLEDLQAFPYTEAVWKEALRLYPPGTAIGRELQHDVTVEGHLLPKGTHVQGNVYAMHRNPQYWRDPESFLPERFLAGEPEAEGSHLQAWMPFGDGARRCIGSGFATQEGVVALVRLYQKLLFRLTPGQVPLKVRTTFTHGPAEGVRVTVHRRRA